MEYENIPILDAAIRCGFDFDKSYQRNEVKVRCPFCDDKKRHLSLNTFKNQFRCNRCKETGNSVSLYAKYFNVDNATAYRELTAEATFREAANNQKTIPRIRQYQMKTLAERHDVYYDLLHMLELSQAHRDNLLSRGLDAATIETNMYRTMPAKHSKHYAVLMYSLSKEHDLSGIPGFYLQNGHWQMSTFNGLLIPVCDRQGYIQGLQIRRDYVSDDKYRWFSSSSYDCGTKAQASIHVANWNGDKMVYVTEGALKAEIAAHLIGNICVIGIAGVNCIEGLAELLLELGVTEVIEALDMDKLSNICVSQALQALKRMIASAGIRFRSAKWNPAFKGIDDFYLALRKQQAVAA